MGEDKGTLLLGGISGLLAGILLILSLVVFATIPPVDPADIPEAIMRYPGSRATFTSGASLILAALILATPLYVALYRTLRKESRAFASFGSVLGVPGLIVLAFSFVYGQVFVASTLSDLYISAATDAERTIVVFLWQNARALAGAGAFVGVLLVAISILSLGLAMLRNRDFPRGFGWASAVLGLTGVVAASPTLVDPASPVILVGILALAIFLLLLGWKVYSMSRTVQDIGG